MASALKRRFFSCLSPGFPLLKKILCNEKGGKMEEVREAQGNYISNQSKKQTNKQKWAKRREKIVRRTV